MLTAEMPGQEWWDKIVDYCGMIECDWNNFD